MGRAYALPPEMRRAQEAAFSTRREKKWKRFADLIKNLTLAKNKSVVVE